MVMLPLLTHRAEE